MKRIFFAVFLSLLAVQNFFAEVKIWDGGGANNNWTNSANWVGDVAPQTDDDLVFPSDAAQFSVNNNFLFNSNFNSITFEGGNYIVNGNAFSLSDGLNVNGGNQRINTIVALLAPQTLHTEHGATATLLALTSSHHELNINSDGSFVFEFISDIGNINKSGLGVTTISDASNILGTINIFGGKVLVDASMPNTFINVDASAEINGSGLSGTGTVGAIHIVNGGVSSGNLTSPNGIFTVNGDFDIEQNGNVSIKIGGINAGQNGYDRFMVNGFVFLNNARLLPQMVNNFSPTHGDSFLIIDNNGTDLINGIFQNAPEGARIIGDGNRIFTITYRGGDGNDVVLRTVNNSRFDFDGDGKADVANFRPANGTWNILNSHNATTTSQQFGLATDKLTPADFDGDGKTDYAVFRPTDGIWYILNSNNSTVSYVQFGLSEDIPMPNDFDGDGRDDVTVFRPATGVWYQIRSLDGQIFAQQFGLNGDLPLRADFDGDGVGDLSVFRPNDGTWHSWLSQNQTYLALPFGSSGDIPIPNDFDGDGKTDYAIFRPSDDPNQADFHVLRSNDYSYYGVSWGITGDIPVAADYDGDGKTDFAVFRPNTHDWYLLQSTDGFRAVRFGQSGDLPIAKAF